MHRALVSAVALAVAMVPGAALASRDVGMRAVPAQSDVTRHNWGQRRDGRWIGGWSAPGGWSAYRPAVRGAVLPRYWINPSFYIADWRRYGLYQPAPGYGWSRYYDDLVLTDSSGRIIDSRARFDWDRYDRYEGGDYADRGDAPPPPPRYKDRDGGLGGAAIGAATGAVAGAILGGRGDRVEGAVIGGVAGAVTGGLIDKGDRAGRGPKLSKRERRRLAYDDYDRGSDHDLGYDDRDYPHHWDGEPYDYRSAPPPVVHHGRGGSTHVYSHGGFGYGGGETVITIHSAPVVTTTTVESDEVVHGSAPRKRYAARKRVWKPRSKPRCVC